jgi:diaminopimelate epimerase
MAMRFHKYQALGNDMVVVDPADIEQPITPAAIRLLCHRHWGIGADGVCYGPLPREKGNWPGMRFFNPDGSEAEKSGNGLRIFARYLWDRGYVSDRHFEIWMNGEPLPATIEDESAQLITTALGRLSFASERIPVSGAPREVVEEALAIGEKRYTVTAVSLGNPHCVIFCQDLSEALARSAGPALETAAVFPNRTNVQFVQVLGQGEIAIEIWERGAGYTLASGTSAGAAAGAAVKTGRCVSPVTVRMPGGMARVVIDDDWRVSLTGPVQAICQGALSAEFLSAI